MPLPSIQKNIDSDYFSIDKGKKHGFERKSAMEEKLE